MMEVLNKLTDAQLLSLLRDGYHAAFPGLQLYDLL